jgi:ATP-dependent DNA ligase
MNCRVERDRRSAFTSVPVLTRRGADWNGRFPRPSQGSKKIKAASFLIHGEAIVYDGKGLPSFALFHSHECSWNSKLRGRFSSMAQRWQDKSLEVIVLS